MAAKNRASVSGNYRRTNENITYLYGSAAPKLERVPQRRPQHREEPERHNAPHTRQKNRVQAKPSPVNVPLLLLTLVAFGVSAMLMIHYISLNSQITALSQEIESLGSKVNALAAENDEYYGRIMSNVDLEKVREVAIMDLGMVYASEGQIITYDSQIDDYVEQSRVIK